MPLDPFLIGFAFAAGAVTFFSPCSVGLFPAYVGYYLGSTAKIEGEQNDPPDTHSGIDNLWARISSGVRLGGLATSGFFTLFVGVGLAISLVGTAFLGSYLRWISIGIGAIIVGLGLLMSVGAAPSLHLDIRVPQSRRPTSIFAFGAGYALASLGCTLPVFISTLLASLAVSGAWGALLVLLAYAAGMGFVMISVTMALSVSEGAARTYIRRVVPQIQRAAALLMVVAGLVLIYYYAVIWR